MGLTDLIRPSGFLKLLQIVSTYTATLGNG